MYARELTGGRRLKTALAVAVVALAAAVGACGGDSGAGSGSGGLTTLKVGTVSGSSADAALFVAVEKGYFKKEGIAIAFQPFDSGARMVAPLGAGQLDLASGAVSAGLFNAIASGVKLKVAADKSEVIGEGFQALVVRKELVDSGKYKDYADLRGMTIALPATGTTPERPLYEMLRKGGVDPRDVRIEQMGFPDMVAALQNGSIDAATMIEPSVTQAVKNGSGERITGTNAVVPGQQTSGILMGDKFAADSETGRKFMRAYIQGIRFYLDATNDEGKLSGPKGDEVAEILTKHTSIKDAEFFKDLPLHGADPNGQSNRESLEADLAFWKKRGYVKGDVTLEDALDERFVSAAAKELGPYKPGGQE